MAEHPIILARPKDYIGVYRIENPQKAYLDGKTPLLVPLPIDTEFWQQSLDSMLAGESMRGRQGVTVQIQSALVRKPLIFTHPDQMAYLERVQKPVRHPVFRTGFAPVDYLIHCGYPCNLSRQGRLEDIMHLQPLVFRLYAHFALAEYEMVATEEYREDLHNLYFQDKAMMTRRFFLQEPKEESHKASDCVALPWMLEIGDAAYRVELSYVDTFAIHGKASYAEFCANVGIVLNDKNRMKELGVIDKMHIAYWQYPEDFDAYSLGDLHVFDAYMANCNNMQEIYTALGLLEYYRGEPRLTIGATVRDLFKARIAKLFRLAPDDKHSLNSVTKQYLNYATAVHLHQERTTARLLAKTEGGRCRNNHPTLAHLVATIVDLDLAGCYGDGQRNQLYPFGVPYIHDYPYNTAQNAYHTLAEFLTALDYKSESSELVPGLWHARVSLKPDYHLTIPQDFLASWFGYDSAKIAQILARVADDIVQGNSDDADYSLDVHKGTLKIVTHDIRDAVITHDFLQWLDHIASPKQRDELLNNLYVHAAMFYPASQQVTSIDELLDSTKTHDKKNTSAIVKHDGLFTKEVRHWECHKWYGVNLGEFLLESLIVQRKMHPKKTPLNELYKLIINTQYGILVSPFFDIGNVTVGNNITSRGRAACWYMEKGFFMHQSITDGGTFDLNNVVFPITEKRRVRSESLVAMYACDRTTLNRTHYIRLGALGDYDKIETTWQDNKPVFHFYKNDSVVSSLVGNDAMNWLNTTAMKHLQHLFPNVDVLHKETTRIENISENGKPLFEKRIGQFEFEAKDIYKEGKFHGSANYELIHENPEYSVLKMRSYERKQHYTVELEDEKLINGDYYDSQTPAQVFMKGLEKPHALTRGKTFAKNTILKPSEFVHNHSSVYAHTPYRPGDTIYKIGLLREFSMAQFTFRTVAQVQAIEKQWKRDKERFGQYIEAYFVNDDGTLDFQRMIETIDLALREGCENLLEIVDPQRNAHRRHGKYHPDYQTLRTAKEAYSHWSKASKDTLFALVDDMLFSDDVEDYRYRAD